MLTKYWRFKNLLIAVALFLVSARLLQVGIYALQTGETVHWNMGGAGSLGAVTGTQAILGSILALIPAVICLYFYFKPSRIR